MEILTCNLGERAKSAKASLLTTTAADDEDFDEEEIAVAVAIGARVVDSGVAVVSSLCIHIR